MQGVGISNLAHLCYTLVFFFQQKNEYLISKLQLFGKDFLLFILRLMILKVKYNFWNMRHVLEEKKEKCS